MSLFGKGPMSEAKIGKVAKLAANPFAQPDVRMREMKRLLDDGRPEALRGVLRRFAANASGHIADEEEKDWLENELVDLGTPAVEPLRAYIHGEKQLTYACRALRRIVGDEQAAGFFLEVLGAYGPDEHRAVEAKEQLVAQLTELRAVTGVLAGLVPFVDDHSDEVRWAVLDLVERAMADAVWDASLTSDVAARLGRQVQDPSTGPRIVRRAAELIAAQEWALPGDSEALPSVIEGDYFVDKKRYLRRKIRTRA